MFLTNTTGINLQATLSASSSGTISEVVGHHHPITCTSGELELDEDGLRCPHASVPADDPRTQECVDHSVAILLIEVAVARFGWPS
jgi:hypothetical protein